MYPLDVGSTLHKELGRLSGNNCWEALLQHVNEVICERNWFWDSSFVTAGLPRLAIMVF